LGEGSLGIEPWENDHREWSVRRTLGRGSLRTEPWDKDHLKLNLGKRIIEN